MKPMSTMNVIPFIDVMLVLLAIVLTTATFVAQGRIPVDLPQAEHAQPLAPESAIEITITADGALFVDGKVYESDDFAGLVKALEPEARLLLRVDEKVPFRYFVRVIDQLNGAELRNVSIVTLGDQP